MKTRTILWGLCLLGILLLIYQTMLPFINIHHSDTSITESKENKEDKVVLETPPKIRGTVPYTQSYGSPPSVDLTPAYITL